MAQDRLTVAVRTHDTVGVVEYDLHGLVGVRLVDASPSDTGAVDRQLGPIRAPLGREPDITIRFVDRLATTGTPYFLGVDEAAFTDDAFIVLRGRHKARARAKVPLQQVGSRCEIVCERGTPSVPLLIPIINLAALSHGSVPLHAAAFEYRGTGVVATGWSKGGKTETLLAFAAHGGRYVADEWAYLAGDGTSVSGIPEPIRVWDWHLRQLPELRRRIHGAEALRLRCLGVAQAWHRRSLRRRRQLPPERLLSRALPVLERQLNVDLAPETVFEQGLGTLKAGFDRLLLLGSVDAPVVSVTPIDPLEVAARMVASLQHERLDFMAHYHRFRFAFPEAANEAVETAQEVERRLLHGAFEGKSAFRVDHPYPVAFSELFDAISRRCL